MKEDMKAMSSLRSEKLAENQLSKKSLIPETVSVSEEMLTTKLQMREARTVEEQTTEIQTAEEQTKETQATEKRTTKSQTEEARAAEMQTEEARATEAKEQTEEARAPEMQETKEHTIEASSGSLVSEKSATAEKSKSEESSFNYLRKTVTPKIKMQDSVFTNLFQNPEYALELYRALHPEDQTTTKEQIQIVTIENVLLNQPYNDFGMMVQDPDTGESKLLVLCEEQSTWSVNILVRMFIYTAHTIQQYLTTYRLNVYSSKRVKLPKPELYVVYTGPGKKEVEQISLSKDFFQGEPLDIEIKAKIIHSSQPGDILNQYISFTEIYKEQQKKYGKTRKTVLETIRICMDQRILSRYLEGRRKEVIDMMMTLFDNDTILEAYAKEIRDEGREEGIEQGIEQGLERGRSEEKRTMAIRLAKMKLPLEAIAEVAGVSVGTIQKWLEEETSLS